MDGLKQLNLAMRYIEENLTEEIDLQQAARLACCSEYHFKRIFLFVGLFAGRVYSSAKAYAGRTGAERQQH
ncbi:hypothetical protein J40TS1_17340 [Paenibacillus montaniterrae]|uniref:HTH araC/xylS-type domain-containing protein n=1 Tax=Paenibacillus montaniterrae TaxID=429341 RepID=A0A919YMV5_9BACL|nr:hypothetical protein J40TS1_17340 [Paenibacillus montaniterrae]